MKIIKPSVAVLGAGWFGVKIALTLVKLKFNVALIDPQGLMEEATRVNQNRVHQGFHYPRSIETASIAAKYYDRFLIDHASAMSRNRRHLYHVAAEGSKVTPEEYEDVLKEIKVPYKKIETPEYFVKGKIAQTFETHEQSFDILKLRVLIREQIDMAIRLGHLCIYDASGYILKVDESGVKVELSSNGAKSIHRFDYVFNCTYSNLERVGVTIRTPLRYENVEVPVIRVFDQEVQMDDNTIMDGEFFSLMRYPSISDINVFALTHVKHGRHEIWKSGEFISPLERKENTKADLMLSAASLFIPNLQNNYKLFSMHTIRTLIDSTMTNDARPVLWEYAPESPRVISVLGSKFTSIYSVLDEVERWAKNVN